MFSVLAPRAVLRANVRVCLLIREPFRVATWGMIVTVLAIGAGVRNALADTATLEPVKDNTIYETTSGELSNGMGEYIFTGANGSSDARRALLAFNLSSIPPGSVVTSASLRMEMSRTNNVTPRATSLFRVSQDWGEGGSNAPAQEGAGTTPLTGDATWLHRYYNNVFWPNIGGTYEHSASATLNVGGLGPYTWTSAAMAADVQEWVNTPGTNYGWIVIGDETGFRTAKRFNSRHYGTAAQRPKLTVIYTLPAPGGACCLPDGSCVTLTAVNCAAQSGTFQGTGVVCAPGLCPTVGPCCLDAGTCLVDTELDCLAQSGVYQGDGMTCMDVLCPVMLEPFVDPLPIPAVAQPISGQPGDEAYYEIAITQQYQSLHRDLPLTKTWGYNGSYPGPTILAKRGEPVTVRWMNNLRDGAGDFLTTHALAVDMCPHGADMFSSPPHVVVHLHGGHVAAADDGYPESAFPPGGEATYFYPNDQLPATIWYHDHTLGITRLNVMMGLAGFYLIGDDTETALGLPSGANELGLAIQDRTFNADGSIYYPAMWMEHFFGDKILVNGKVWPYLNVSRGKYRFRMLNGSTSRSYTLSLSNAATFHQIASDGGLFAAPVPLTQFTISPGERADVVIDFEPYAVGTELILTNSAPAPYPGTPGEGVIPNVMKFIVGPATGHTAPLPQTLRPLDTLPEATSVLERQFLLRKLSEPCTGTAWYINGLMWDDITEFPVLGTTEVWSFVNRSGMVHPMHMHLVMFQVLDRQVFQVVNNEIVPIGDRMPPDANEIGWKDTVRCNPFEITRVITKFTDFTGLFPYHCHILEHEDHEMMRQFRAVCRKGDTNQDTKVNGDDISLFVDTLLTGGLAGTAAYCATDMDDDSTLESVEDVAAFVDCLVNESCP